MVKSIIVTHQSLPIQRRRRRLAPFLILGFTGLLAVVMQLLPEVDRNIRAWLTLGATLLGVILLLLWLLFFSDLRWQQRIARLGLMVGLLFLVKTITRTDGAASGTGIPRLVWRWLPTKDEQLAQTTIVLDNRAPVTLASAAEKGLRFAQFLGPNRDGRVDDLSLFGDWVVSPPKELWRRPVGLGWTGFVVADGLAITQEQVGENELVTAYVLRTGQPVWAHTNRVRFQEFLGGDGPRSTPTIVGDRVYAFGGTGILDCLSLSSGQLLWSVDVLKTHSLRNDTWGKSSAPLVVDGRVIVSGGTSSEKGWLAYDAETGRLLWAANGEAASYASAVQVVLAGVKQILVTGPQAVAGLDPASGKAGWRFVWGNPKNPKCSQPVMLGNDRIFVSAGYGAGCAVFEVALAEGLFTTRELWRGKSMKTQFNNVAVREGHLYGLDDGFMACVDITTGKRLWKDGRYGSGQTLLVGNRVLVQSEPGWVALVEAKPSGFTELGRINALQSKTWNNPALAGRYLLVRNDQEAVCYELPSK